MGGKLTADAQGTLQPRKRQLHADSKTAELQMYASYTAVALIIMNCCSRLAALRKTPSW
jgi:hypothetical protein